MRYENLPRSISNEHASEIIRRLKAYKSLADDKNRLIQGYMRLVWNIAKKTHRYCVFDDVFGVGCLTLVEIVDRIFAYEIPMYNEDVWLIIKNHVWHRCKEQVGRHYAVSMPDRTIRHQMLKGLNKEGKIIPECNDLPIEAKLIIQLLPPTYQPEMAEKAKKVDLRELRRLVKDQLYKLIKIPMTNRVEEDISREEERAFPKNHSLFNDFIAVAKKPIDPALLECIDKAANTYREKEIIALRAQGYTYQEIGEKFFLSAVQIGNYVNRVEQRFSYLYDEKK